jgi:hypothetical protein
LAFASLNIDGFTESSPILALQYGARDMTTGFWTTRVRASAPLFANATVFGELGYEGLFSTDDAYTAKLAFNTANAVSIGNTLEGRGFLKGGVGGSIAPRVGVTGE